MYWQKKNSIKIKDRQELLIVLHELTVDKAAYERDWDILSDDEKNRSNHFRKKEDQQYFVLTRAILRRLIAEQLSCHPEDIEFHYGLSGKPTLPDSDICFNVSHTDNMALIALAKNRNLGVDLENTFRSAKIDKIAKNFFLPEEREYIAQSLNPQESFFYIWTRKEAILKALGEGFFSEAKHISVLSDIVEYDKKTFQLHQLPAWKNYHLSLACEINQEDKELIFRLCSN